MDLEMFYDETKAPCNQKWPAVEAMKKRHATLSDKELEDIEENWSSQFMTGVQN